MFMFIIMRASIIHTMTQASDVFLQRLMRELSHCEPSAALLARVLALLLSDDESRAAKAAYATLWARAWLAQPSFCVALLAHLQQLAASGVAVLTTVTTTTSTSTSLSADRDLFASLLDAMLESFDAIGPLRQRKLLALGLCAVVGCGDERALARLELVLNVVIDVALQLEQALHDEFDVSGLAPNGALWVSNAKDRRPLSA